MIYGILYTESERKVSKESLFELTPAPLKEKPATSFFKGNVALGTVETGVPTIDDGVSLASNSNRDITVVASGNIFKIGDRDVATEKNNIASLLVSVYENDGERGFASVNGQYSAAIWDQTKRRFVLTVDHVGFEPLFYYQDEKKLIFSSSFKYLVKHSEVARDINHRGVRNYLLFSYNPGLDTFVKKVKKLQTGHCLVFENEKVNVKKYWHLSYANQNGKKTEDYVEELLALTKDAIRIRTAEDDCEPGAFLSGGMDSSSVVGLLSSLTEKPVHTFSFRCDDKDVDESHFARVMAKHYKTRHNELEFEASELENLAKMTEWMQEPLCDIGVELGSFILGRKAKDHVKYILTGDGGDELYAGHPVYIADNIARKFDAFPAPVRNSVTALAGMLPDSERKKSLTVKARRFSYSYQFPAELLSNRWRIYYDDSELSELCNPDFVKGFGELNSYQDIIGLYEGSDATDLLSRSLYGDYQTLVHFHVDRLRLTRAWGVEARFPLHDYRLIEFSGTIPPALKIKGSQVKYIQKKAMEGVLPDEIVFRKDKMGHNVPMKNWMRNSNTFRDLINDVLSETAIKKRNFFNADVVNEMLALHLASKKDYSHRLYALLVLEMWMQNNLD